MTIDTTHIKEEVELNIDPEEEEVLDRAFDILQEIRDGLDMESNRRTSMCEIEFVDGTNFNFYGLKKIASEIVELLTNESDN